MVQNANRPPVSATDAVKPYREPSIVLMSMDVSINIYIFIGRTTISQDVQT